MSDKTTAVKVQGLQPEAIHELNPMETTHGLSDLEQILTFLQENHLSSAEVQEMKEMIENLPEEIEERTKALLKPAEGKSQTFQLLEQQQEIAQEQLEIAKANTELLVRNLELHEENIEEVRQQTKLMEQNKKEMLHLTSLVQQFVGCQPSQMPSSRSGSSVN